MVIESVWRRFLLVKEQRGNKEYIGIYDSERELRDAYFKLLEEMNDDSCDAVYKIYLFHKEADCLKQYNFEFNPEEMKWRTKNI